MKNFDIFERVNEEIQSLNQEQKNDPKIQELIFDKILRELAESLKSDNNLMAKAIATYIRCGMENFHSLNLSDDQRRKLNAIIRNSIFTFLEDYASGKIEKIAGCITLNMSYKGEDCEYIKM